MSAMLLSMVSGVKHACQTVTVGLLLSLSSYVSAQPANYVGSEACIDCHADQVEAWQGSHHDMAMKHADKMSVLGDFDDARVIHDGKENRFFSKREGILGQYRRA